MNGKRASAHGKVVAAAEAMLDGRWVAATSGRALSHVIPHRHTHTEAHTQRERATYFISCKCPRKYEHYIPETEAAAFARKRQAGRQEQRGRGGRGKANWDWQDIWAAGTAAGRKGSAALIKVGKQLKPLLDRTPDYNSNNNNWDDYDVFTSCRKCRAGQVGGPSLVLPASSRK